MNQEFFTILQQFFRNDPEGLIHRKQMLDSVRKHFNNLASELSKPEAPLPEEKISEQPPTPIDDIKAKKRRLLRSYLLGEILGKPVSVKEDGDICS